MSARPGARYAPLASTIRAPFGTDVVAEGPIAAIRLPETTTV